MVMLPNTSQDFGGKAKKALYIEPCTPFPLTLFPYSLQYWDASYQSSLTRKRTKPKLLPVALLISPKLTITAPVGLL